MRIRKKQKAKKKAGKASGPLNNNACLVELCLWKLSGLPASAFLASSSATVPRCFAHLPKSQHNQQSASPPKKTSTSSSIDPSRRRPFLSQFKQLAHRHTAASNSNVGLQPPAKQLLTRAARRRRVVARAIRWAFGRGLGLKATCGVQSGCGDGN